MEILFHFFSIEGIVLIDRRLLPYIYAILLPLRRVQAEVVQSS